VNRPIGLFDSGFGGLTVMKEVARILPQEELIYLGDTAHLPYGDKSPESVVQYSIENAAFLLKRGIKLLIVPCHTACCHAIEILKKTLPIPVIGVIEPGLELIQGIERIAILGTTSTIESGLYQTLIRQKNPNAILFPKACPLFVPLIEEGFHYHPSMELIAQSYLEPIRHKIDAVLLACTHYPLIRSTLQKTLGPNVFLIDPAEKCAIQTKKFLSQNNLLNCQTEKPVHQFYSTNDPEKFQKFGEFFFGAPIEKIEKK
jgi:glutamate racemase